MTTMSSKLSWLEVAWQQGDLEGAYAQGLEALAEHRSLERLELVLAVAGARLTQTAAENGRLALRCVQEIEARFSSPATAAELIELGRFLYLAGQLQEASRRWFQACERDPGCLAAIHLIALAELERARSTPLQLRDLLIDRWRRAWSQLCLVAMDERHFGRWVAGRCGAYGIPSESNFLEQARRFIVEQLLVRMSEQASEADKTGRPETASALRQLASEFQSDLTGQQVFAEALRRVELDLPADIPFPFGLLWYRSQSGPSRALDGLRQVINASSFVARRVAEEAESGQATGTYGSELRQWYSRLSPVLHAVRWGHFDEAAKQLSRICGADEECQVNPQPHFPTSFASPRCCHPGCSHFARCNPGYATGIAPAMEMELDAYRLGIFIQLALAQPWLRCEPPACHEAARHWVWARTLAQTIGETSDFEEQVTGQVLGIVVELRHNPAWAVDILRAAMGAVPSAPLRGRLADRLTDLGIEQCNLGAWEEGVHDLRLASTLNRHADRAAWNLALALQNLAVSQVQAGQLADASTTVRELVTLTETQMKEPARRADYESLRNWAADTEKFLRPSS